MPIRMSRPGALSLAALFGIFANTDAVPYLLRQADYIRETDANSGNWGKTPGTQLQQNKGQSGSVTLPP